MWGGGWRWDDGKTGRDEVERIGEIEERVGTGGRREGRGGFEISGSQRVLLGDQDA